MTSWKRRLLAGIAGLAVLTAVAVIPTAQLTEAQFTDTEYTGPATFTSTALVTPSITGCTIQNLSVIGVGLVFQSVTLTWTSTYPSTNMHLTATSGTTTGTVPAGNISASGPVSGVYSYSATLNQALLTSLVSNLLGSTTTLTLTSVLPGTSWVSPATTRKLTIGLLGLGATCTV